MIVDDGDEIAALRAWRERLDAEGALVSADALHCNEETAILDTGADYRLALKGNNPTLHAQVEALPRGEFSEHPPRPSPRVAVVRIRVMPDAAGRFRDAGGSAVAQKR